MSYISCATLSPTQKNCISIDCDQLCFTVLFAIPTAIALLQCIGVLGCGWPRLASVCQKIIAVWQLWKSAPSSTSAADVTKNLIIVKLVWNALFNLIGSPFLGIQPMKKCPHAQLCAPSLDRYVASECIFMTISDAWNLTCAS